MVMRKLEAWNKNNQKGKK